MMLSFAGFNQLSGTAGNLAAGAIFCC